MFQAFNLLQALSAVDNVAVPMWNAGRGGRMAKRRASELLTVLGLGDRLDHRPADLSGGHQQRVAIARARALDQPTAHLDADHVQHVLQGAGDRRAGSGRGGGYPR